MQLGDLLGLYLLDVNAGFFNVLCFNSSLPKLEHFDEEQHHLFTD